jgi:outer membrane protein assembly factor BamE (lipoprotein component of BamABCDE complex)
MSGALLCLVAASLVACAWVRPEQLPPGSSADEVRARMGAPNGQYPLPGGGVQWEYATGPFGRQTYHLDFGADQRLQRVEQVLSEANFNTISAGMSDQEVLRRIGRPSTVWPLARQQQNVWSYRYQAFSCQWFMVGMGYDQRVIDTAYGPDPLCEQNDSAADRALR